MKRPLLSLALLAALPFAAHADELSYTYVEGGYYNIDGDASGPGVAGSVALGDSFHLFGGYQSYELHGSDFDIDTWNIGIGFNHALGSRNHLVARLGWREVDTDFGSIDGYQAEVGLRSALGPRFESYVAVGYADGDDLDGDYYGKLEGQYRFNRNWGLVASATFSDGANAYFVGPRISF